jgi:uncharacterized protein (TIGR02246 family)
MFFHGRIPLHGGGDYEASVCVGIGTLSAGCEYIIHCVNACGRANNERRRSQSFPRATTGTIQEPEQAHRLFVEAFNSGNLDALVALYEPEAITFNKENQPVKGSAQIREALSGFLSMKPHITLTTRDALRNGELALLRSQWEMTFTGPDGKPVQIAHRSTEVVRLQKDGRWLYVIDNPFWWGLMR